MHAEGSVDLEIMACAISGNSAVKNSLSCNGGGFNLGSNVSATLTGVEFIGNEASLAGGGIYHSGGGNLTMVESIARSNVAVKAGFAHVASANRPNVFVNLRGLFCEGNVVAGGDSFGGCLYLIAMSSTPIAVTDSVFIGNKVNGPSSAGGAVYALSSNFIGRVLFRNVSVIGNGAGGIALASLEMTTMQNVLFLENFSGFRGGGILLTNGSIAIEGAVALANTATDGGFASFRATKGSSKRTVVNITGLRCMENIAVTQSINVQSSGGCITSNFVQMTEITDSYFTLNQVQGMFAYGGSLFFSGGFKSRYSLRNVTVTDSGAQYFGGGLLLNNFADFQVADSIFLRNDALYNQGVDISIFYTYENSALTFFRATNTSFLESLGSSIYMQQTMLLRATFSSGCQWRDIDGGAFIMAGDRGTFVEFVDSVLSNLAYLFWLTSLSNDLEDLESRPSVTVTNTTFSNYSFRSFPRFELESNSLIFNRNAILEISGSTFQNFTGASGVALIVLTQQSQLKLLNSSCRSLGVKALAYASGSSLMIIETVEVSGNSAFERATFFVDSSNATMVASNVAILGARSRCGLVACIEKAASSSISSVSVVKSSCVGGDPLLASYAVDCGVVVILSSIKSLKLDNFSMAGFVSLAVFALISDGGSLNLSRIRSTGALGGGLVRVVSTDGCGKVTAEDLSASAGTFSSAGSLLQIEYMRMSCSLSKMLAADITRAAMVSMRITGGVGSLISLSPSASIVGLGDQVTLNSSGLVQVTVRGLVSTNVTSTEGGSLFFCSGARWNVSIQDSQILNLSAIGPRSLGGAAILQRGCKVLLTGVQSLNTKASSGGFVSVLTKSRLELHNANISKSIASAGLTGSDPDSRISSNDLASLAATIKARRSIVDRELVSRAASENAACTNAIKSLEQIQGDSKTHLLFSRLGLVKPGSGGVIMIDASASVAVRDSTLFGNFAIDSGGVVHVSCPSFSCARDAGAPRFVVTGLNVTAFNNAAVKGGVQYNDISVLEAASSVSIGSLIEFKPTAVPDNCARVGPDVGTAPASLRASFQIRGTIGEVASAQSYILSGDYLPTINVVVLDGYAQQFLDASFFSMILFASAKNTTLLSGRVNQFGIFGSGVFSNSSIRILGSAGNHSLLVAMDGLFAQYPSSLMTTIKVLVKECPPGRYVESETRACSPCPLGTFSTKSEASLCSPVPVGSFTLDGVNLMLCEKDIGPLEAGWMLRRNQCMTTATFPVLGVSLGVLSSILILLGAGSLGMFFHRKQLLEAEARSRPWLVRYKDLEWIRKIGEGSCGEVFMCKHRGTIVCVKRIKLSPTKINAPAFNLNESALGESVRQKVWTLAATATRSHASKTRLIQKLPAQKFKANKKDIEIMQFEDEINLHLQLRHPNIVLCMGAFQEPEQGNIGLLTEFMHLGG
jgi:hypothetical protein